MKKLLILAAALFTAAHSCGYAQQYPSPTFNNVTINGTLNGKSIPTGAFVGTTDTQTLTNKTLTTPRIGSGMLFSGSSSGTTTLQPAATASGTLTLPAATDTLIGKATTDTLTNKTFNTAGTGNSFLINGTSITAVSGTGSVALTTSPSFVTPSLGAATGTSLNLSGLTASSAVATDGSKNLVSVANTGTGNNVLATSPTLVTPNLGTPSAATLTNATGLPISTGVSGLGTGVATFLATPSSANLASALTNETGTGAAVFGTTPTLNQPNIVGTTTNDNASSGSVGEYVSSNVAPGSAVSMTTSVANNVTSVSLSAGDWDCRGNVATASGGSVSQFIGWISTTSASAPTDANGGSFVNVQLSTTGSLAFPVGEIRISIASTTTVYLSSTIVFGGSRSAYGFIGCRRVR